MDEFRGLNLRTLSIDHAWLVLNNHLPEKPAWLYVKSDDCDQVTKQNRKTIPNALFSFGCCLFNNHVLQCFILFLLHFNIFLKI